MVWARVLAINLNGTFHVSRATIPHLRERGGAIVNISSQFGLVGCLSSPAYCASKAAVIGLTKAMAIDHAADAHPRELRLPRADRYADALAVTTATPELAERERARTQHRNLDRPADDARGDRGDDRVPALGRRGLDDGQRGHGRRRLDRRIAAVRQSLAQPRARSAGTRPRCSARCSGPSSTIRSPRASTKRNDPGTADAAERRPAEPVVDRLDRDRARSRRIPDDDVGVGARRRSRPCPGDRRCARARRTRPRRAARSGSGAPSGASVKPIGRRAAMPGRPGRDLAEVADRRELLVEARCGSGRMRACRARRRAAPRASARRSSAVRSGGRHHVAHGVGAGVVGDVEQQVVRAHLAVRRHARARARRRSRRATRRPLTCTT